MHGASGPRHYRGHVANGRVVGRFEALLGLVGLLALVVTYSLITKWNPLPAAGAWLAKAGTFSDPAPAWKVTVGNQPTDGTLASGAIVIGSRGSVEAYQFRTGEKLWAQDGDWAAVAGGGAVVIVGRTGKAHGYNAVNPDSGHQVWGVDNAIGVWTFTDLVVDLTCPDSLSCVVTARNPVTGAKQWTTALVGNGRTLAGANKALSELRSAGGLVEPQRPAPPLLGFTLNDQVQVVDTATGKRLHSYEDTQTTRVVLAGDHVLVTTVLYRDGHCKYAVDGRDPTNDRLDWHLDGYDLHTTDGGLGCDQRKDPQGSGNYVVAFGPDNREQLLDSASGKPVYRAAEGEEFADVDGRVALVRSADVKLVRAIDLSTGSAAWSRVAGKTVKVGLGPGVAIFVDPGAGQLAAVTEQNGQLLLNAKTGATVLGYSDNWLVINVGRTVGLLTYGATTG
jgi:hypothetical protein